MDGWMYVCKRLKFEKGQKRELVHFFSILCSFTFHFSLFTLTFHFPLSLLLYYISNKYIYIYLNVNVFVRIVIDASFGCSVRSALNSNLFLDIFELLLSGQVKFEKFKFTHISR